MSLENILSISGLAMDAQTARINLSVSNIANADTQDSTPETAFKAKRAVFRTILDGEVNKARGELAGSVRVSEIIEDQSPHPSVYLPSHPLANEDGYVFSSNVDVMTEMVDIKAASRSFESAVEASNTAKRLMMRTIEMLQK
jgi:flagellar basal-body rod protein FlgC